MTGTMRRLAALVLAAFISAGCSNASSPATGTAARDGGGTANQAREALRFAACMRANGVKEFPDPEASGDLTIDAIANGSSVDTNSEQFQQAMTACKDVEPAGF